jgi:hypothetical protein
LQKALLDRAVYDRMSGADAVLVGQVTSVDATPPPTPVSEHSPLWTDARVQSMTNLVGEGGVFTVRFSKSTDICCAALPKLTQRENALFIVRKGAGGAYYAEKGDVLPAGDEPRLRAVLACPPDLPPTT